LRLVSGQENDPDGILPAIWDPDRRLARRLDDKVMRNLKQDSGSIARSAVAAAGTSMFETLEYLKSLRNDRVRRRSVETTHETHATGVALLSRIVQAPAVRMRSWNKRILRHSLFRSLPPID
jgi:hypothetical protein